MKTIGHTKHTTANPFTGRYVSLKYRIYLYNIIYNYEIK